MADARKKPLKRIMFNGKAWIGRIDLKTDTMTDGMKHERGMRSYPALEYGGMLTTKTLKGGPLDVEDLHPTEEQALAGARAEFAEHLLHAAKRRIVIDFLERSSLSE